MSVEKAKRGKVKHYEITAFNHQKIIKPNMRKGKCYKK